MKNGQKGIVQIIRLVLLVICIWFIFTKTVIGRQKGDIQRFQGLFWEYKNGMWLDIGSNILLFVPLGMVIGKKVGVLLGFLLSCFVETIQYIGNLGYCELDDILNNTIGTIVGVYIYIQIRMRIEKIGLRKWEELPEFMRTSEIKPYYEMLKMKQRQIVLKRLFDFIVALILLILLIIPMGVIAIIIKMDSNGPALYRQERVTTYGQRFRIHKFRTMVNNADKIGSSVTVSGDKRVTKVGRVLRHYRIDELPQLFDVIEGNMSFVGTRPEAVKYVDKYQPEFYATLLMPAGITSEASIRYKDEDKLLNAADDVDEVYIEQVLPAKMEWNLESIRRFGFLREIITMIRTVLAVLGKEYL